MTNICKYFIFSSSIWQHLKQMSTVGNKTIIITTHSIEEARQADRVCSYLIDHLLKDLFKPCIYIIYQPNYNTLKVSTYTLMLVAYWLLVIANNKTS